MNQNYREDHPIYKINKTKIMIKATIFALGIVGITLLIVYLIRLL